MSLDEKKMNGSKKRTQNLMKTLQNSGNVVEKFEKIIEDCKANKIKYIDHEFYPQSNLIKEDQEFLTNCEWKRAEEQYPSELFENISPESIRQGKLSDCYFIVALIYASQNKDSVKLLFHPQSSLKYGCVLVYFNFLGQRIPVIIDTQIPFKKSKAIFAHPKTSNDSCWFVLVEKAFAKACGGYFYIAFGESHFGVHILLDTFCSLLSEMNEIQNITIEETKEKVKNEIFDKLLDLNRKNAMIGSYVTLSSFPNKTSEQVEHETGLLTDHAYYILDVKEIEKKKFLKIRNPWGKFEWKGDFSKGSKEWTESLKNSLNYNNTLDGSFWILYDDFLKNFKSICYSLKPEKNWKKVDVCGKIDGYLDGRVPCVESRNTGCIPQWSIKFTKKTVVRLTYDYSGPETYHCIYIVKNHGRKVDLVTSDIEMKRGKTDSTVGGIEYNVEDFSEPFTFFLTRTEQQQEPCYYRILVESPDTDFVVKKFDDDFIKEKWNFVSDKGVFNSTEKDQWNPFSSQSLITCKQWYFKFPKLKNDEETELRIRFFKNLTDGPLFVFIAKTDQKVSFTYKRMKYYNFKAYPISNYEEFMIPINNKDKNYRKGENKSGNDEINQYVLTIYRNKQTDLNKFQFVALSKTNFEFGLMPGPDPIKNCGYSIKGILKPGENDGSDPKKTSVKNMKQWCLTFKKSPTVIFVNFYHKNAKSIHKVFLERKNSPSEKIDRFSENSFHFELILKSKDMYDQAMWKIEDISKPYALCITRNAADSKSEYFADIFGNNDFQMLEINENGLGKSAPIYNNNDDVQKEKQIFDFDEVKFVEQPSNFKPKK